jgi:hypothetical protein
MIFTLMTSRTNYEADRWRPQLTDEFTGMELEGVTSGVLGRKWLFKQENESLWELDGRGVRCSVAFWLEHMPRGCLFSNCYHRKLF